MTETNTLTALAAALGIIPEAVRQGLYETYSDVFKSYEGIRPRWAYDWSIERLEAALDRLDERAHECACEQCAAGETCWYAMPTEGEGWSFIPAE